MMFEDEVSQLVRVECDVFVPSASKRVVFE